MLRAAVATVLASGLTLLAAIGCGGAEQANADRTGGCPRIVENAGDLVPDPPDGVSLCPAGVCNYQSQEGCGAGTACAPVQVPGEAAVEPGCVRAGTRATGDTCDADNPCEPGNFCVNSNEGSYCRKMCCGGDWSACDDGQSCFRPLQLLVMGVTVPAEVSLCFDVGTCDVLSSATCDVQGYDCKMVDPTGQAACIPRSPEKLGEPCSSSAACARGLTCVGEPGDTRCRRLCRAEECGEPACPAAEGICVHFNRDPPFVGECTPGF
jgi:hypothetical protein